MTCLLSIANFGLIPEYDDLVSLGLAQAGPHNLSALDNRVSHKVVFVAPDKQHFVEFDGLTFRHTQTLDFYCLFGGYLVLFAAYFNYSVNLLTSIRNGAF
jgi:hypothetical protein